MGRAIQLRQFQALLLFRTSDPPYFLLLVRSLVLHLALSL